MNVREASRLVADGVDVDERGAVVDRGADERVERDGLPRRGVRAGDDDDVRLAQVASSAPPVVRAPDRLVELHLVGASRPNSTAAAPYAGTSVTRYAVVAALDTEP
ncbi:hypothetical protein, partial [Halogeometricum sp. CBA1124]|uniref:hypothetical protein n=1 Tax=Halogeometricum sp. CBA1124 TaxID=2668071 RepID=UPI002108335C